MKRPGNIMALRSERKVVQMKKLIKAAAVLTAAAFLGGTGTYGYFSDTLKVKNHISTGDINIGLKEYEKKGSTEVSFAGTKAVVPGDVISKIPRITNYASPCWVRARITYKNDRENMEGFSDKNISGMSKKWVQRGEYYYYTSILKRKDSTDLFKEVTVPDGGAYRAAAWNYRSGRGNPGGKF